MDSTLLVDMDIRAVPMIMREFDARDFDLRVVLVAQLEEYGDPRLILASPNFEQGSKFDGYLKFGEVLSELESREEIPEYPGPLILTMVDPFVVDLQTRFGRLESKFGKRLRFARLGRRHVEDGYVFRVS